MCSLQTFLYIKQFPKDSAHLKALVCFSPFFLRCVSTESTNRRFWSGKSCTVFDLNTNQLLVFGKQGHGHSSNILHRITLLSVHDSPLYKTGYYGPHIYARSLNARLLEDADIASGCIERLWYVKHSFKTYWRSSSLDLLGGYATYSESDI